MGTESARHRDDGHDAGNDDESARSYLASDHVNFRDLDLNLLIALDALLGEQSVSRAARTLHRSQPALSASLKRLRYQFQDELLVRVGNRYELTPLGAQLKGQVARTMADVERLFASRARFDPATSTRQFVIHSADYGQQMLGRELSAEIAEQAPNVRLNFRPLSDQLLVNAADEIRNVDAYVIPLGFIEGLPHMVAYEDRWVLMVDRANTRIGDHPTLDELAELDWVSAFHRQTSFVPAVRHMQLLGISVRVVVDIAGFAGLPWFVKGTDRVAMIQERLARRIAPASEFRLVECPFEILPLVEAMWWHPSFEFDPGHIWLRTMVERACHRIAADA